MYNDQDIFIREIVSNAIDATQKLITVVNANEYSTNTDALEVNVILNKEEKTITVSDMGIGMTEDEINRYINQIAFSGANDFIKKYADANIIGHFGLGFYSSFMVSDLVEIKTRSYKETDGHKWSCEGTTDYEITDISKDSVGTDIIMHLNDDYIEYLDFNRMKSLLLKYSKYLPITVNLVNVNPDTTDPSTNEIIVNDNTIERITSDNALWTKQPSTLSDEDYINFYHELYPGKPDPLFWIHINIDMPFTFTGILYFPAFDPAKPVFEHKHLSLYCNRVYVTDNVEGILPQYLGLLHGIIDSPDIPLNVSRSFLQNDSNVKKISKHITNKVMSALSSLMEKDRKTYEEKWDTIKLFINLGIVTEANVYEKAKNIVLLTDIDNNKYTFNEYYELVKDNQTDKDGQVIYLYTYDTENQYTYIDAVKRLGYNILLFNDQYCTFEVQAYETEQRSQNISYKRIDSNVPELLIQKGSEDKSETLSENLKSMLVSMFSETNREIKDIEHSFEVSSLGEDALPLTIIADEWFRRMKEMSIINNSGLFLGQKSHIIFVINSDAKVMRKILKTAETSIGKQIQDINDTINNMNEQLKEHLLDEDISAGIKSDIEKKIEEKQSIISEYSTTEPLINEIIDIALLQYGLLNGEEMTNFVKRSIKMIED